MKGKGVVVVTGGTGYIGSHTAVELQRQGYDVVIIDNLVNSHAVVVDRIADITGINPRFFRADVRNQREILNIMSAIAPVSGVIHFAAFKAVGESVAEPLKYYDNNIGGLVSLLQCMKEAGIPNFIFSSSCTVYGEPDRLPVGEEDLVKPAISPYGYTKQIGERIVADAIVGRAIKRAIALRYFNPVGADASARIGEWPIGVPNNLVPYITQVAAGWAPVLRIFGDDYPTADGTAIRDYIHVSDLAVAHEKALTFLIESIEAAQYQVMNIGTGHGYSVREVVKAFEEESGMTLPCEVVERRPGDVAAIWADSSYAKKILGWQAAKDIHEMMRSAWVWQQALGPKQNK